MAESKLRILSIDFAVLILNLVKFLIIGAIPHKKLSIKNL